MFIAVEFLEAIDVAPLLFWVALVFARLDKV
jgi:hypothetical protein